MVAYVTASLGPGTGLSLVLGELLGWWVAEVACRCVKPTVLKVDCESSSCSRALYRDSHQPSKSCLCTHECTKRLFNVAL